MGGDEKDGVVVTLLHQVKDPFCNLILQVKDIEKKKRKDLTQKKAMQVAQKVSDEPAKLKTLNSEKEGIKALSKGKLVDKLNA